MTTTVLSLQVIVRTVERYFYLHVGAVAGQKRPHHIVIARHAAMYLAREHTNLSLDQVGYALGGRDHTTVLHGVRTTKQRMLNDPLFAAQVMQLEQQLGLGAYEG